MVKPKLTGLNFNQKMIWLSGMAQVNLLQEAELGTLTVSIEMQGFANHSLNKTQTIL